MSVFTVEVVSLRDYASSFFILIGDPLIPWMRVPVFCEPFVELRRGLTIDVEGTITTLKTGERTILAKSISFYLDEKGRPCALPPVGRTMDFSAWPWKTSLDVSAPPFGDTLPSEPPPGELLLDSQPSGDPGTISWAKTFPDGTILSTPLTNKVVAAGSGDFNGFVYIQETGRSCGIRVITSEALNRGDRVNVSGEIDVLPTGEVAVIASNIQKLGVMSSPKPLGISGRDLGAGAFWEQEGIYGAFGLNNVGLLVKAWGEVLSVDQQNNLFHIGDGWMHEGPPEDEIRVLTDGLAPGNSIYLPVVDSFVGVTGIASCCKDASQNIVRAIRPRSQEDIRWYRVEITSPQHGTTIHKPTGAAIAVSGVVDLGLEPAGGR